MIIICADRKFSSKIGAKSSNHQKCGHEWPIRRSDTTNTKKTNAKEKKSMRSDVMALYGWTWLGK